MSVISKVYFLIHYYFHLKHEIHSITNDILFNKFFILLLLVVMGILSNCIILHFLLNIYLKFGFIYEYR